jgi:intein/homing endonuclease
VRITRLYLRGYRVFGDELDLPMPAGLVGIYGVNGAGKCLPGSTRVWDANTGEAVTIERFVTEERKWILGYRDGRVERVPVSDWMCLGEKPLVRVDLSSGASLEAAQTHPVLTDRGCIRAGELQVGDWVAEARRLPAVAPALLTEDEALLVGLLLGDGCVVDRPTLSAMDDDVRNLFRRAVESIFPSCTSRTTHRSTCCVVSNVVGEERRAHRRSLARRLHDAGVALEAYLGTNTARFARGEASPSWETLVSIEDDHGLDLWQDKCALHGRRALLEWVRERGLLGHDAFSKHVPDDLLLLPEHLVAQLVAGLWLTDGYVSDPTRPSMEVSYTSVSERLARDVRVLLLRLGLTSTIRRRKVHGSTVHTVKRSDASRCHWSAGRLSAWRR